MLLQHHRTVLTPVTLSVLTAHSLETKVFLAVLNSLLRMICLDNQRRIIHVMLLELLNPVDTVEVNLQHDATIVYHLSVRCTLTVLKDSEHYMLCSISTLFFVVFLVKIDTDLTETYDVH